MWFLFVETYKTCFTFLNFQLINMRMSICIFKFFTSSFRWILFWTDERTESWRVSWKQSSFSQTSKTWIKQTLFLKPLILLDNFLDQITCFKSIFLSTLRESFLCCFQSSLEGCESLSCVQNYKFPSNFKLFRFSSLLLFQQSLLFLSHI